ncbi:hypothetical protein [Billgrantia antri]|uniref:hypothetical protein n=1 Tax=Billgrantia antri TaxID=2846777 RepID=UPI003B20CD0E
MTEDEHQRVIEELESLIGETRETLAAFESTGMDEEMTGDYEQLQAIFDQVNKQQRAHTFALLREASTPASS